MTGELITGKIPGGLVKLSQKRWINAELFLEWFNHFICSIPPTRHIAVLMDSHASHVPKKFIDLAKKKSY